MDEWNWDVTETGILFLQFPNADFWSVSSYEFELIKLEILVFLRKLALMILVLLTMFTDYLKYHNRMEMTLFHTHTQGSC